MNKKPKKRTTTYKLKIDGNYDNFDDFFQTSKGIIYNKIIEVFENLRKNNKNTITLRVKAVINEMEWDTVFNFHKKESFILTRDILPYFETIEDYEMCEKINKLYNSLSS